MRALLLLLLLVVTAPPLGAGEAVPVAEDPAIEARLRAIGQDLRCLVCQNETILESNAKLAVDLRRKVRDLLEDGQNDEQIIEYLTARYGDFVLYRPPFRTYTLLLWLGPVFFFAAGALAWYVAIRRRSTLHISRQVTAASLKQASVLLGSTRDPNNPK
jgi:cytochrome c-type biogenesis protein CcmH